MVKVTQEVAIERIRAVHGDQYDYSSVIYVDSKTKITLKCSKHGEFQKTPEGLWGGSGCEPCRQESKIIPVEEWVTRFRSVHGDRYDYSLITDLRHPKMATIICREHGEFQKQPHNHWTGGAGCPVCSKAILTPQSNRYSREQWIARFQLAFGDRYDYSKFELMGARGDATFVCRDHGVFQQSQQDHAIGRLGCEPCRRSDAGEKFFKDARERFGDRYGYEKFEYFNAKTKSVISCPEHGDFTQNPDKHLRSKYPCPVCNAEVKLVRSRELHKLSPGKPRTSPEEYLMRLILPDGYSVDMANYVGLTEGFITLTCPQHGESAYGPQTLLVTSYKCSACARDRMRKTRTKGYEDFISKAREVHGDTYAYPDFDAEYANRKSIVEITCAEHGVFKKKAQKHLSGQGCFRCGIDELIRNGKLPGGYNLDTFAVNEGLGDMPGTVYYLKVGDVFKIGITAQGVRTRANAIKSTSKLEVTILQTYECSLKDAYIIEQSILKLNEDVRVARRWSTELFSEDVLKDKMIGDIKQFKEVQIASWGSPSAELEGEG